MTIEEALTEIKERIHITEYVGSNYVDCVNIEALRMAIEALKNSERIAELAQNVSNDDLISKKAAIEVIDAVFPVDPMKSEYTQGLACGVALAKTYVEQLPSAQPEIIRCKDCKWKNRHNCTRAVEVFIDDDKYCAWAERRTDEIN